MDTPVNPTLREVNALLDEKDRLLEEFTRTHGVDPEARASFERGKEELLGRVRQHLEAYVVKETTSGPGEPLRFRAGHRRRGL